MRHLLQENFPRHYTKLVEDFHLLKVVHPVDDIEERERHGKRQTRPLVDFPCQSLPRLPLLQIFLSVLVRFCVMVKNYKEIEVCVINH